MNCKDAYTGLLSAERPDMPAAEVAQHLSRCPKCQQRQRRIILLEQELAELPRPGESPEARLRLLERLPDLEPPPSITPPSIIPLKEVESPRWLGRGIPALVAVAAAVLFLVIGLVAWLGPGPRPAHSVAKDIKAVVKDSGQVVAGPADHLVTSLLESDLRLARLTTVPERVETLIDMAGRLQNEAIRLARQGQADEVAWLHDLHEQVVVRGLAVRGRSLTEAQRQQIALALEERAASTEAAALPLGPAESRHLQAMSTVSRQTAQALLADREPPALPAWQPPADLDHSRGLLGALVWNGIRLAGEDDPLRRADYCTDIADSLLQSLLAATAAGSPNAASTLGQRMGDVMDRGVAANLSLVESAQPDPQRQAELDRLRNRNEAALDEAIKKGPPGLQKALEESKGKGKGKSKGKGKDPNFVPPGQMKKKD